MRADDPERCRTSMQRDIGTIEPMPKSAAANEGTPSERVRDER
jgi:hypothetical protein